MRSFSAWADQASARRCWRRPLPKTAGFPKLHVLDSTDPAQIRALETVIDVARTVFIVSSKSGGTTEPNALKDYFHARVAKAIGADRAGHRFIAITDPGSSLDKERRSSAMRAPSTAIPRSVADIGPVAFRPGPGGDRRGIDVTGLLEECPRHGAILRGGGAAA